MNWKQLEYLLTTYEKYRKGGLSMTEAFVEAVEDYVFIYGDGSTPLNPKGILDISEVSGLKKEVMPSETLMCPCNSHLNYRRNKNVFGKGTAEVPSEVAEEVTLDGPIVLDLGEVRDEPVVTGWHAVRVERAEAGLSRQKNLPKVFFLSRIIDEGDPEFNRTVIWNCMLKGDGLMFTKRCFAALGLPEQLNYPTYQDLADDTIGREVEVQVKHKVYKGERQAQVSNWRPLTPEIAY